MKIVFVVEHFRPYVGGVEQLFGSLADALVSKGHTVVVVTSRYRSDLPKEEQLGLLKIVRTGRSRFWFTLLGLFSIIREISKAQLVHTTSYNAALPAWIAARLCRKPVIITFHEVWDKLWLTLPYLNMLQRWGFYFFEKLIIKLNFNAFIGVSDFTACALKQRTKRKVFRIYNGLDYQAITACQSAQPVEPFVFCFFGRAGSSKGLDLLMPSAEVFMAQHPEVLFRLIVPKHNTSAFRAVQRDIQLFGYPDRMRVYHHLNREELFALLCSSSCVVIPSYSEGFCFAAAEAVALGLPVISSGRGALPEVVGGKHIFINELNHESVVAGLNSAFRGEWTESSPIRFELEQTVAEYLELYMSFGN